MLTAKQIADKLGVDNKIGEVLKSRGMDSMELIDDFINTDLDKQHDPANLPDIEKLIQKIKEVTYFGKIGVYSDYDVDGVTSAYLFTEFLDKLSPNAEYDVFLSNRFKDGYGLSRRAVDYFVGEDVDMVVTLDCGITAYQQVEYAKSKGLEVMIFDHHESQNVPDTEYFLDLKVNQGFYPFRELCTAGLIWKVGQALLDEGLYEYIDETMLATVADVVPLVDENRIIVSNGLDKIKSKSNMVNEGIKLISEIQDVKQDEISAEDIAFSIAPPLNAVGRLGPAYDAFDLLKSEDNIKLNMLVEKLRRLNKRRQDLTSDIMNDVNRNLDKSGNVIVEEASAHQGLVGLIAGRITSRYKKPSMIVDERTRKGSARSVKPFNIYENLNRCYQEGLLEKAGGHEMAAGFEVKKEKFDEFKERMFELSQNVDYTVNEYDVRLDTEKIDYAFIDDLKVLEPCGEGNEKPLFLTEGVDVTGIKLLTDGLHVKFKVDGIEAIAFRMGHKSDILRNEKVDIIYTLGINDWNDKYEIQMIVRNISRSDE